MVQKKLLDAAAILAILVLSVIILVYAKPFLVPLTFAAVLSMLLLPLARWLQGKGLGKGAAALCAVLALVCAMGLIGAFIGWQISGLAEDASNMEQAFSRQYQQAQQAISEKFGIAPKEQEKMFKQQSSGGGSSGIISGFISGLGGFLTDLLLVLVYMFLMLLLRSKLKGFILRLMPREHRRNALNTVNQAQQVAQQYFSGLMTMIACLWVMYGIGFTIVGVKHAFFFAILCGILEIVPFVGNLTGTALTMGMALIQGSGMTLVIGILITYALVQFIQTYILEPLIVGANVNINPLFTIAGIVAGELLWGVAGMILAIPLLGVAKIVCDHVEPLKPYGYLIGQPKKENAGGLKEKIRSLLSRKKS